MYEYAETVHNFTQDLGEPLENNVFHRTCLGKNSEVANFSLTGECNIELAMGEYRCAQLKADSLQCLALTFVDSHGKGQFDGILTSSESEVKVLVGMLCMQILARMTATTDEVCGAGDIPLGIPSIVR